MGPNFKKGISRIGRDRLPPGIVAILDDSDTANLAIGEMHEFVVSGNRLWRGRAGVVFRVVDANERDAYNWHVQRVTDDVNSCVGNLEGFRHTIDVEHIGHIHGRHCKPEAEEAHGQVALRIDDFFRVPQIVKPKNLIGCRIVGDMQRLAYRRDWDDGRMTAVQEIRVARKELALVTLYKQK